LAVLLGLLTVASCHHRAAPSGKRTKPKLVVLVVIDQWPSWVFEKQRDLFKHGIGRLLEEGGVIVDGELPYASTFTSAGHAALGTGAPPRESGIVANAWYRRDEGRDRPAEYDPDAPLFSVGEPLNGAPLDHGASAKALRVDGIAEALRAGTNGAGRSVAIAA
jgi:predicted AlkP superfamily pyrophosphatase or phosphodiesterase